ncbi:MAG: chromate efflux transporter [Nitrospirae bacterium]|nr:chromate efflux transporter [Nitrospirota bacterium]
MNTPISFREAFFYWLRLGFISFGGPTGQIAIMHRDIVDKKKWIDEDHFLQALNYCMLLPGPEAQQLATYIGWLMHGKWGGIVAGVLFVLPSVFILWLLSWMYAAMGNIPSVAAFFYGLKPAVVAIVAEAVIRIGRKSLKRGLLVSLASLSFISIYFLKVPFPAIVFSAGIIGYIGAGFSNSRSAKVNSVASSRSEKPAWAQSVKVLIIWLCIWFLPIILIGLWRGWDDTFIDIGVLFSKASVVTFGGAYSVLAYIGQQAVGHYHWISPEQMIDGLGLAETTPGPLIMVNQFVGYLAGYHHAKGLSPASAGMIGGFIATWVTFVPSFLWIFLGAPFIERLRSNIKLNSALGAITAAVVGVVLSLAVTFTGHVLFPESSVFDWFALSVSLIAFAGMQYGKWPMIPVIIGSAIAGFLWKTI